MRDVVTSGPGVETRPEVDLRHAGCRWTIALAPSLLYLAALLIGAATITDRLSSMSWSFVGMACAAGGTLLMTRPPSRLKSGPGFAWNVTYLLGGNAPGAACVAAVLQTLAVGVFLAGCVAAFS